VQHLQAKWGERELGALGRISRAQAALALCTALQALKISAHSICREPHLLALPRGTNDGNV
jgi:hypothetical protein